MNILLIATVLIVPFVTGCEDAGSSDGDDQAFLEVGHHQEPGEGVFTVDENGNAAASLEKELIEKIGAQAGFAVRFRKVDYPEIDFTEIEDENELSGFFQAFATALDQGSVDVVIGNFWVLSKREQVVDYLTPHLPNGVGNDNTPVAFFVKRGNTELKTELNAALEVLREDGTIDALIAEYNVQ